MIAKAAAITKDYLRWAVGTMLVSAVAFFSISLAATHLPVFLLSITGLLVVGLLVYYFEQSRGRRKIELSRAYLDATPRHVEHDQAGNIVSEQRVVTTKKSGFLMREQIQHQYWVVVHWNYHKPVSHDFVLDEIRAHVLDFRACGIEHVHVEIPNNEPRQIVIACRVTRLRERHDFDAASCRQVLASIAGTYAAISPIRMIEGPREQLQDRTVIEAF